MKKLLLPFLATVFLCACSHNPPQPYGSEFPLNTAEYYQKQGEK